MRPSPKEIVRFQRTVFGYYKKHGREFPWRSRFSTAGELRRGKGDLDPYGVLVSEVMLQQTQVDRVIPKYLAWMKQFPTPTALARAATGDVVKAWQGLGYNRRALNLKRAAERIVNEYGGVFPKTVTQIDALPGVGPYTAGAIAAFAFDTPSAFIETNIRTVYLHFFFKGKREVRDEEILKVVEKTLPKTSPTRRRVAPPLLRGNHPTSILPSKEGRRQSVREWYNALMDYGAMLKATVGNPNIYSARYTRQSKFTGSRREVRGEILRKASVKQVISQYDVKSSEHSVQDVFAELVREGFLKRQGNRFTLA